MSSARMRLGTYTFGVNPTVATPPAMLTENYDLLATKTYTGKIKTFDWGAPDINGTEYTLQWTYVQESQFLEFNNRKNARGTYVFDPQTGDGKTYTVRVKSVKGKMLNKLNNQGGDVWRRDVQVVLLILEEVV